jgi:hypothetical protein
MAVALFHYFKDEPDRAIMVEHIDGGTQEARVKIRQGHRS